MSTAMSVLAGHDEVSAQLTMVSDRLATITIASSGVGSGAPGLEQQQREQADDEDGDEGESSSIGKSIAMFEMGKEEFKNEKFMTAIGYFDDAIALHPNYVYYFKKAESWTKLKNYYKAQEALLGALKLKPGDRMLKNMKQKNTELALIDLEFSKFIASTYAKHYDTIEEALEHRQRIECDDDEGGQMPAKTNDQDKREADDFGGRILHRRHSFSRSASRHSGDKSSGSDFDKNGNKSSGSDLDKNGKKSRKTRSFSKSTRTTSGYGGQDKKQGHRSRARTPARSVSGYYSGNGLSNDSNDSQPKALKSMLKKSVTAGSLRTKSGARGDGYVSDTGSVRSTATTVRRAGGASRRRFPENGRIKPDNVFGHFGIFVDRFNAKAANTELLDLFGEFGHIVEFKRDKHSCRIIYDNANSPAEAIYKYHMKNVKQIAYWNKNMRIRFEAKDARRPKTADRKWSDMTKECFFFRTTGCDQVVRMCSDVHYPMCRGIDFQKYMNAATY